MKKSFLVIFFITFYIICKTNIFAYELKFIGKVEEVYDDNIFAEASDKESDFITNILLGIDYNLGGRSYNIDFLANVNQQIYATHRDEDNNSQDAAVIIEKEFSRRDKFLISDTLINVPKPAGYSESFSRLGSVDGFTSNSASIKYTRDVLSSILFDVEYIHDYVINHADELSNTTTHSGISNLQFMFNAFNIVTTSYGYSHVQLEDNQNNVLQSITLSYEHLFSKRLSLFLGSGVDLTKTETESAKTVNGEITLADYVDDRSNLAISFTKGYSLAAGNTVVTDEWQVTCKGNRELTKRLGFEIDIFYGQSKEVESDFDYKFTGSSLGFAYDLSKYIALSASYSFTMGDSSNETDKMYRNNIFLTISAEY